MQGAARVISWAMSMQDGGPPQFAAYPRPQYPSGSPDKLRALSDGYFGLNRVFVINIVLVIGMPLICFMLGLAGPLVTLVIAIVVGLVVGFMTFPYNRKIGYGCGWSDGGAILASTLMGINSALCCGIIGYIVVQQIAAVEMKKYGIKTGFLGMKKNDIEATIAAMSTSGNSPYIPPPTP